MHGNRFFTFLLVVVFFSSAPAVTAGAADSERIGTLSPAADRQVRFEAPPGWRLLLPQMKCVVFAGTAKVCSEIVPREAIGPCRWIEAAGRFMDAPGDRSMSVETAELESPPVGFGAACTGVVQSPRQNAVYLRAVLEWDGSFLVLVSAPLSMDSALYTGRFQDLRSGFEAIVSSLAPLAEHEAAPVVQPHGRRPDFAQIKKRFPGVRETLRSAGLIEADRLRLRGKLEEAASGYQALRESYPYDSLVGLADIRMARLRLDEAEDLYREALELNSERPDAFNGLGSIRLAHGDLDGAGEYFNRALEKDPTNSGVFVNRGWLAMVRGDWLASEEFFMSALANVPELDAAVSATNGLTEVSLHYGEYGPAIAWNVALLKEFTDYPEGYANLVRSFLAAGRPAEALQAAKLLEKLLPDLRGAIILSARAHHAASFFEQAADRMCPFAAVDSDVGLSRDDTVICIDALLNSGKSPRAIEILRSAIHGGTVWPALYILLARAFSESGDSAAAHITLKEAISKYPDDNSIISAFKEFENTF